MKFIMFWEYLREDTDKVLTKFQRFQGAVMKEPEKHVKPLFPPHHLAEPGEAGMMKGITIYETDDEEKLIDYVVSYFPEMRIKIVPLQESAKTAELYLKTRK